jgi:hypothetical protein
MVEKKSSKPKSTRGKKSKYVSDIQRAAGTTKPEVIRWKLVPEVIQIEQEEKKDNPPPLWNFLGESSIAVTVATAILFMVGWTYESNWYAYFNISTSQVSLPIPQVLIRSLPTILVALLIILISIFLFPLVAMALNISAKSMDEKRWWVIFTVALTGMFLFSFYVLYKVGNNFASLPSLPEAIAVIGAGTVYLIFVSRGIWLVFVRWVFGILSKIWPFTLINFSINEVRHVEIRSEGWIAIGSAIYILALLLISSSLALRDATLGQKGIGLEKIQKVLLVSPKGLSFTNDMDLSYCIENNGCIYGPFSFIAENENTFFLAKWTMNQSTFPRNLGLYKIPRSDTDGSYAIVPASITLPTAIPTTTGTASPTATETLVPQATFTEASTPQPTLTMTSTP